MNSKSRRDIGQGTRLFVAGITLLVAFSCGGGSRDLHVAPDDHPTGGLPVKIHKRLLISLPGAGGIQDIQQVSGVQKAHAYPVCLTASSGYFVIDTDWTVVSSGRFPRAAPFGTTGKSVLVQKHDDIGGFLRSSGPGPGYDDFLGTDGEAIWRDTHSASKTLAGDLNRDGVPEFVQTISGNLRVFSYDKSLIWEQMLGDIGDVEIADAYGHDGGLAVILLSSRGRLVGFSREGRRVAESKLEDTEYFDEFSVLPCAPDSSDTCVLVSGYEGYRLFSLSGEVRSNVFRAPYLADTRAAYEKGRDKSRWHLIISGTYLDQGGRSFGLASVDTHFYMSDNKGTLLFKDIHEGTGNAGGMLIIPDRSSTPGTRILLGGKDAVWEYTDMLYPRDAKGITH